MKRGLNSKLKNSVDTLILFNSVILILMLILVMIGALQYGINTIKSTNSSVDITFILGIEIAIVTIIGQWIQGRFEYIINYLEEMKGGINHNAINKKTKKL